jgi:hypothetical protein
MKAGLDLDGMAGAMLDLAGLAAYPGLARITLDLAGLVGAHTNIALCNALVSQWRGLSIPTVLPHAQGVLLAGGNPGDGHGTIVLFPNPPFHPTLGRRPGLPAFGGPAG